MGQKRGQKTKLWRPPMRSICLVLTLSLGSRVTSPLLQVRALRGVERATRQQPQSGHRKWRQQDYLSRRASYTSTWRICKASNVHTGSQRRAGVEASPPASVKHFSSVTAGQHLKPLFLANKSALHFVFLLFIPQQQTITITNVNRYRAAGLTGELCHTLNRKLTSLPTN